MPDVAFFGFRVTSLVRSSTIIERGFAHPAIPHPGSESPKALQGTISGAGGFGAMTRPKILIVEDEPLIAMDLEHIVLETLPAEVLIKSSVDGARQVLHRVDFAFLDVNVINGLTFGVGEFLMQAGVPFVFLSASPPDGIPTTLRAAPFIGKPATPDKVKHALRTAFPSDDDPPE